MYVCASRFNLKELGSLPTQSVLSLSQVTLYKEEWLLSCAALAGWF
jgi:hypothetical protein